MFFCPKTLKCPCQVHILVVPKTWLPGLLFGTKAPELLVTYYLTLRPTIKSTGLLSLTSAHALNSF
jgi:hypothetical protein